MPGLDNLDEVLQSIAVSCDNIEYGFTSVKSAKDISLEDFQATFLEKEGLALIARKDVLDSKGIKYEGPFAKLTIDTLTSLDLIGLTAVLAQKLADNNISANVVAAFYHDHIFVQYNLRHKAIEALNELKQG